MSLIIGLSRVLYSRQFEYHDCLKEKIKIYKIYIHYVMPQGGVSRIGTVRCELSVVFSFFNKIKWTESHSFLCYICHEFCWKKNSLNVVWFSGIACA